MKIINYGSCIVSINLRPIADWVYTVNSDDTATITKYKGFEKIVTVPTTLVD